MRSRTRHTNWLRESILPWEWIVVVGGQRFKILWLDVFQRMKISLEFNTAHGEEDESCLWFVRSTLRFQSEANRKSVLRQEPIGNLPHIFPRFTRTLWTTTEALTHSLDSWSGDRATSTHSIYSWQRERERDGCSDFTFWVCTFLRHNVNWFMIASRDSRALSDSLDSLVPLQSFTTTSLNSSLERGTVTCTS